jgi:multiple antibiotic resistance protein
MLHVQPSGQRHTDEEESEAPVRRSVAVVPIAIPLLAGPGAISTSITLARASSAPQHLTALLVIAAVALVTAVTLFFAPRIQALPVASPA